MLPKRESQGLSLPIRFLKDNGKHIWKHRGSKGRFLSCFQKESLNGRRPCMCPLLKCRFKDSMEVARAVNWNLNKGEGALQRDTVPSLRKRTRVRRWIFFRERSDPTSWNHAETALSTIQGGLEKSAVSGGFPCSPEAQT